MGRSPLSSGDQSADAATGAVTVLGADDLRPGSGSALLQALDRQAPGLSLSNAQGEAHQPTVVYRGFQASPLQGVAQGLAVYVDGVRLNQPFGETVNWDLIPEAAIRSVTLQSANPTYGLNALGGSLAVRLKSGFDDPGGELEASGASFGRSHVELQYGAASASTAIFVAASGLHDNGWRRFSPTTLRQVYVGAGWRTGPLKLDLGLTGANNELTGNGPAPVELLAADRRAVFTHPDSTHDRYGEARLSAIYEPRADLTLQGQVYAGRLRQQTANGDLTDATPCAGDPTVLCLQDDGPLLTDAAGRAISVFSGAGAYGALNVSSTDTSRAGAAVQLVWRSPIGDRPNDLTLGVSLDAGRTRFAAETRLGSLDRSRGFVGPGIAIDQPGGPIKPVGLRTTTQYAGIYISDTAHLTPALAVTVSGRFDRADLRLTDQRGSALNGVHRFDHFNPALGLTYALGSHLTAYGGYAGTSRTPTPAELSCASPAAPCSLTDFFVADPPLKLVTAATMEAGLRGRSTVFGGTLSWSAGLFRADTRNDISRIASDIRGRGFFENIGRSRRQGVEAQAQWIAGRWRPFVAYAFTDATFRTALTLASLDNPAADASGLIHVRPGDRIPLVVRHSLKGGVAYEADRFRLQLDAAASSGRTLLGDEANLTPPVPDYVVANLAGSIHLTPRIVLFGSIENLANTRYATFGTLAQTSAVFLAEAPGASNPRSFTPAPPRTFELGLRASF